MTAALKTPRKNSSGQAGKAIDQIIEQLSAPRAGRLRHRREIAFYDTSVPRNILRKKDLLYVGTGVLGGGKRAQGRR